MSITFDEKTKTFYLSTKTTSYIMHVFREKYLTHIYWGKKINSVNLDLIRFTGNRCMSANPDPKEKDYSMNTIPLEFSYGGRSDYRMPVFEVTYEDGCTIPELLYEGCEIIKGKPELEGLPHTYTESEEEAETLIIRMYDAVKGLRAYLYYTVYEEMDGIVRSIRYENAGKENMFLNKAYSMIVDFQNHDYEFLRLPGGWAKERRIDRSPLSSGTIMINSRRGASSLQMNPFFALVSKGADENHGEAYGVSLVYSGNFQGGVETDETGRARLFMGLDGERFTWELQPGTSFQTPETVLVYSGRGIGGMSRIYHRLYRLRLCRGKYRDAVRPILVNNWEATYFNFTEKKLLELADDAKELGIELLVLDDGWFGKRNDDDCSLGDWVANRDKLPNGIDGLAKAVNRKGLKFGLWFEPEMVNPDSDLYRKHPDWIIHVAYRPVSEGRNQCILDLSREDVCNYIIQSVSDILDCAPVSYVKWDMNRNMTEYHTDSLPGSRQGEFCHRYMLGLYKVMEKIVSSHPDVLFESCSSGGGRFDPGMLYYMPQTWTSDDTDGVERIFIQYGTSIVYPISSMGAHVSASPNHQLGRSTSLKLRGDVAMSGNFGYELDLTKFTPEEKEEAKNQVALYKELRRFVPYGEMYRLRNPFEGNTAAWMVLSEDGSRFFLAYFRIRATVNAADDYVKLDGLLENARYRNTSTNQIFGGDELMEIGLPFGYMPGDGSSVTMIFEKVE